MSNRRRRADTVAGELLRHARKRARLTQRTLAQAANVPQSMVAAVERGWQDPSVTTLVKLVEATGCSLRLEVVEPPNGCPSQECSQSLRPAGEDCTARGG